jgi:hypothetical protein
MLSNILIQYTFYANPTSQGHWAFTASVNLEGSEVASHLSAGTGFTGRNLSSATKSTKSANTSTDLEESDAEEDGSGTLPGEDEENYNLGQMRRQDSMTQEEDNDEEDDVAYLE